MQTFDVRLELGGTTSMRVGLLADLAFLSPSVDDVSDDGPTAMRPSRTRGISDGSEAKRPTQR